MKLTRLMGMTVATLALGAAAQAESWDMPMAYSASNFHSEMGQTFAEKVGEYSGGDLIITVHPGGSLFKGGEIKRAIQTGQVPIGERLMSSHANETPLWAGITFRFWPHLMPTTKSCGRPLKTRQCRIGRAESGDALQLPMAGTRFLFQQGSDFLCRHAERQIPQL